MEEIQQASIMVLLSGLLVGVLFGFVLQRGRYCMNSAFRDIIFVNDFTLFRSYLLALLIAIICANLLEDLGAWENDEGRALCPPVSNSRFIDFVYYLFNFYL